MSWPTILASEVMLKRGGSVNPSKFPEEVFDLLSIPAFDRGEVDVKEGAEIGSSKSCVEPNDVLLSKIIPHVKRCWVVPEKGINRQIGSGEWIIFRDKRFHSPFLRHFLTSNKFHQQFMNTVAGVGGSLVRARPAFVEKIEIPLPPLKEQKRIAAILDKADAIRRKRQKAIKLADDFLRSVFLDMFGDPVTNPKGWEVHPVGDGLKSISAGWSAKGLGYPCGKDSLGVLKISAVTSGEFKPSENKFVEADSIPVNKKLIFPRKGDLLFSRANTRELVAATCIVQEDRDDVFLPDKLWLIKTDDTKFKPEFLNYMIWEPRFKDLLTSQATGTSGSMLNISKAKFEGSLAIFPDLDKQEKFGEVYWEVRKMIDRLNQSNTNIEYSFNSLSKNAFLGGI